MQIVIKNKKCSIDKIKKEYPDCVIIDEQPALAFCNKNPELQILEEEFAVEDYALVISKENPELLELPLSEPVEY